MKKMLRNVSNVAKHLKLITCKVFTQRKVNYLSITVFFFYIRVCAGSLFCRPVIGAWNTFTVSPACRKRQL